MNKGVERGLTSAVRIQLYAYHASGCKRCKQNQLTRRQKDATRGLCLTVVPSHFLTSFQPPIPNSIRYCRQLLPLYRILILYYGK